MRKLSSDERGSVNPYLMWWVVVIVCAFIWIVCNEFVLYTNDLVTTVLTESPGSTWAILLTFVRMSPMIIILGTTVWAIVQSHRHSGVYP